MTTFDVRCAYCGSNLGPRCECPQARGHRPPAPMPEPERPWQMYNPEPPRRSDDLTAGEWAVGIVVFLIACAILWALTAYGAFGSGPAAPYVVLATWAGLLCGAGWVINRLLGR